MRRYARESLGDERGLRVGEQLGWLHGTRTSDELFALLRLANLFSVEPIRGSSRLYRRWAFESAAPGPRAAPAGLSLEQAVGRPARPVSFVASIRLGEPPSLLPLRELLAAARPGWGSIDPDARLGRRLRPGSASLAAERRAASDRVPLGNL